MAKIKVLIVEDEQLLALDLKEKLEEMGFVVTGITDTAEQTINEIKESPPDVILMDIIIEGNVDGVEAADRIRLMFNIPVIFLTAFTDEETMHRAKLSEPFAYLVKPYNEWELKFIIEIATYKHDLEKVLAESEKSYRTLTENLPGIVYRTYIGEGNRVQFSNHMLREITGYSPREIEYGDVCSIGPLIIHEDKDMVRAEVERAIREIRPFGIEYRVKHKNGNLLYFFERGNPVPGKGQTVLFVDGVIFDISERKKTEEALRQERGRAQRYLDIAGVMIVALNKNHEIELINRKGCEILGYEEKEMIGKDWFDFFIPPKAVKSVKKVFARLLNGKIEQFEYFENPVLTKSGEEKMIAWNNIVLHDETGAITGTLSSGLDISQRERMEEEMQKTAKLESLGLLAGGIAHDFNNNLTAILININLAKMYIENKEQVLERLGEAEKAVSRAQDLTQQLMTFSKGGSPVTKIASIGELLRDTAEFALTGSNISAEFSIGDNLRNVKIDRVQVCQVFQNIISNAEQAMPEGGVIRISAENEIVTEDQPPLLKKGKYIKVSVSDSGIGIPTDHLDKIFDPFFTTKQRGSGLGLSTSYSIIKNHMGLLAVESKLGKGSTFSVYLPAAGAKTVKKKKEKRNKKSGSRHQPGVFSTVLKKIIKHSEKSSAKKSKKGTDNR